MNEVIEKAHETNDELDVLLVNWDKYEMEAKINRMKPRERKAFVKWLRDFSKLIRFTNAIIESCYDKRYSFSLWKWFELAADVEKGGYGYAREKHKIEIIDENGKPTGKYWKVTKRN